MPRRKKAETTEPTPTESQPVSAADSTPAPAASAEPPPPDGGESRSHAASHRPKGAEIPNPFESRRDGVAGVRLLEDRQFKQMQIKFDEKPSQAVLAAMDAAGYTWRGKEKAWTRQLDPEAAWKTRADAERLYLEVAAMIRAEKGITTEVT